MKIDLEKEDGRQGFRVERSHLSWLLWECMAKPDGEGKNFFNELGLTSVLWAEKKKELDVRLTIEGIDVPVREVFEFLFEQHYDSVKLKAEELYQEKIGVLMGGIEQRMQDLNRHVRTTLGLPDEES